MAKKPQSFENHAKMVPAFHGVTTLLILGALTLSLIRVVQAPSMDTGAMVLLSLALGFTAWFTRSFPLKVQDRLIRLEERLRMSELLPGDLQPRIPEFSTNQLIALRFASDAELPELARRVLEEGLTDRKEIKVLIREWKPDYERM